METSTDDTSDGPNETVISALQQLLYERFPKEKCTFKIDKASAKGENYVGVIYRIVIALDGGQKDSIILKVPPRNVIRRKQMFARPSFLRESLAYEEFLPLIREFQETKGLTKSQNGFYSYPKCYLTLADDMNEAIFLEDLRIKNFELFDRFQDINEDHVAFVMRSYARLHAVSFALKDQQPEKIRKFQNIIDIFVQRKDEPQLSAYFEELKKSTLASLDEKNDERYIEVLKKYFSKAAFIDLYVDLIEGTKYEPYAVVCHGDCWINNFMFNYKNDKVIDIRLIDWQVMRYASPFTDLMYFLFTCTTKEFRDLYFTKMLDIYYDELSNHIKRLGSDPVSLFSREAFDKELIKRGAIGLLFAMIVLPIITINEEDVPNLDELSERIEAGAKVDLISSGFVGQSNANTYNKRMRETVVDCIDFGYI